MSYELQCIDCSCSDCGYMVRDVEARKEYLRRREAQARDVFERERRRLIRTANDYRARNFPEKYESVMVEVDKMRFQFSAMSVSNDHFGFCKRFEKRVVFTPGVCRLETQECFVHRKGFVAP